MTDPKLQEVLQRTDVGSQRIAKVYAQSLLDVAAKAGQVEEVLSDYRGLVYEVAKKDPRLGAFFTGEALGRYARRETLERTLKDRIHPLLYNFLQVLNDHERLHLFRP